MLKQLVLVLAVSVLGFVAACDSPTEDLPPPTTLPTPPAAPAAPTAQGIGANLRVNLPPAYVTPTGYSLEIYYAPTDFTSRTGGAVLLGNGVGPFVAVNNAAVSANAPVDFYVRAVLVGVDGAEIWSEATAVTLLPPTQITASEAFGADLTIEWDASTGLSYEVLYSATAFGDDSLLAGTHLGTWPLSGGPVTDNVADQCSSSCFVAVVAVAGTSRGSALTGQMLALDLSPPTILSVESNGWTLTANLPTGASGSAYRVYATTALPVTTADRLMTLDPTSSGRSFTLDDLDYFDANGAPLFHHVAAQQVRVDGTHTIQSVLGPHTSTQVSAPDFAVQTGVAGASDVQVVGGQVFWGLPGIATLATVPLASPDASPANVAYGATPSWSRLRVDRLDSTIRYFHHKEGSALRLAKVIGSTTTVAAEASTSGAGAVHALLQLDESLWMARGSSVYRIAKSDLVGFSASMTSIATVGSDVLAVVPCNNNLYFSTVDHLYSVPLTSTTAVAAVEVSDLYGAHGLAADGTDVYFVEADQNDPSLPAARTVIRKMDTTAGHAVTDVVPNVGSPTHLHVAGNRLFWMTASKIYGARTDVEAPQLVTNSAREYFLVDGSTGEMLVLDNAGSLLHLPGSYVRAVTGVPPAPTPIVEVGDESLSVFMPMLDSFDGLAVYVGNESEPRAVVGLPPVVLTGLPNAAEAELHVLAFNLVGDGPSATLTGTPVLSVPELIYPTTGADSGEVSFTIDLDHPRARAGVVHLYRDTVTPVATTGANLIDDVVFADTDDLGLAGNRQDLYVDSGDNGTLYYYVATLEVAGVTSAPSAELLAMPYEPFALRSANGPAAGTTLVEGLDVYWTYDGGIGNRAVYYFDGADVERLDAGGGGALVTQAGWLAADVTGATLFHLSPAGAMQTVDVTGLSTAALTPTPSIDLSSAKGLLREGTKLVARTTTGLYAMDTDGSNAASIYSSSGVLGEMTSAGGYVYFVESNAGSDSLLRVSTGGGASLLLASATEIQDVAIGQGQVYYSLVDGPFVQLWRVGFAGGTAELVTALAATGIGSDGLGGVYAIATRTGYNMVVVVIGDNIFDIQAGYAPAADMWVADSRLWISSGTGGLWDILLQ